MKRNAAGTTAAELTNLSMSPTTARFVFTPMIG
jgi:hypothetical protein